MSRAIRFLADAVLPMDHGPLFRQQLQRKRIAFIHCFELLLFAIPAHPPILVPDPLLHLAHACDPGASSIHMFHVIELSTFQIAERQVCQIDVTDIPRSGLSRRAIHSLPEKRELEAELASFASSYV